MWTIQTRYQMTSVRKEWRDLEYFFTFGLFFKIQRIFLSENNIHWNILSHCVIDIFAIFHSKTLNLTKKRFSNWEQIEMAQILKAIRHICIIVKYCHKIVLSVSRWMEVSHSNQINWRIVWKVSQQLSFNSNDIDLHCYKNLHSF